MDKGIPEDTLKALVAGSLGFADEGSPEDATIKEMAREIITLRTERDEALKELEQPRIHRARNERLESENATLKAQLEQITAERDVLRGVDCEADGDGPCGVCIKCYKRKLEQMQKPVTDEEWENELVCYETDEDVNYTNRAWLDAFLASRSQKAGS